MNARRDFLRQVLPVGALGAVALNSDWLERIVSAGAAVADRSPAEVAADESYWREIQQAFTLDRTIINLNNGYTCPSPRVVHEALKRYLDISNQAPIHYMWNMLEPNVETVRRKLAAEVGCDPEELAITRNASEALQIAQLGIDLQAGDEVVTTNQDYGRMLDTWDQRVRRDRIAVTKISFPVPTTIMSRADRSAHRARSRRRRRCIHICHITNLTGQLFPVRDIARMARARGIQTIVDGAHAFAHFPFKVSRPRVRLLRQRAAQVAARAGRHRLPLRAAREHRKLWPLTPAAASKADNIRKFEEIGTHPAANHNAIAEALAFHQAIGTERKAARLRYLNDRWANAARQAAGREDPQQPRAEAGVGTRSTSASSGSTRRRRTSSCGPSTGSSPRAIKRDDYQGLRVTPNVYTTLEEVDTFAMAIGDLLKNGTPSTAA